MTHDADALLRALAIQAEGYGDEPLRPAFEQGWKQWTKAIGLARNRYSGSPKKRKAKRQRIAILPDLHAPFHERAMFADFIAREAGKADLVLGIGDIGDSYALSRFVQYEHVPYREEWAEVNVVIQALSEAFPSVQLILGNHDVRLERQLRAHVTKDIVDAVRLMTGGVLCPITALAKRYPNVSVVGHETPSGHKIDWFTQIGDALFLHAEKFSRVPGSALRSIDEWAQDNRLAMGIPEYRLLVQAHTHQMALFPWSHGRMLVECGCLCQTQGYMTQAKISGRPQRRGYVWFEQEDGRTNLNSLGMHCYDVDDRFTHG